jgi:hypothetical protein
VGGTGGRGAWLCRGSVPCLEEALRRRALGRALRAAVSEGALARMAEAVRAEAQRAGGNGGAGSGVWEDGGPDRRPARPGAERGT